MTTYDRALHLLESIRRPGEMRIHPHDAVEALAQAGLLTPELPEPIEEKDGTAWWEPCGPEYAISVYNEPLTRRHLVGIDETACDSIENRITLKQTNLSHQACFEQFLEAQLYGRENA